MIRKDYNTMILKRIEISFNKLIPIGALIAWISAYFIYDSVIPIRFAYINIGMGIVLMVLFIFRKSIHVEVKIMIVSIIAALLGVLSFLHGGFSSGGMVLLIISNIIIVAFLSKIKSIISSVSIMVVFIGLWLWAKGGYLAVGHYEGDVIWSIKFMVMLLYLIIMQTIIFAIRKYLLENILELEDSIDQTYKLAYYDQLTGLPNQFMLKEEFTKRAEENSITGYLVLFDLKDFNLINSIYSESVGNEVIITTSQVFNEIKNDMEFLAKVDGNKLVYWSENLTQEAFEERLEYVMTQFHLRYKGPVMKRKVEFFLSYAHFTGNETNIGECYQKAQLALVFAKTHNISKVIAYDGELEKQTRYEAAIKEQLEEAIITGEFQLYYQTKVNALTGEIVGVEALARWNIDSLGTVGPNVFIPIIEKMNMSVIFGEMIIKKALAEYEGLCEKYHKNIQLSINISPSHLISQGFVQFVKSEIGKQGINPNRIILEITEEVIIKGVDIITDIMKALKEVGVKISLDDFGTGYSSLNYLATLNIDELKVDKSFIDQIEKSHKINILLKVIIQLTELCELNIVAEGVETKEQCDMLVELGYNVIQGYYYSRPEPL